MIFNCFISSNFGYFIRRILLFNPFLNIKKFSSFILNWSPPFYTSCFRFKLINFFIPLLIIDISKAIYHFDRLVTSILIFLKWVGYYLVETFSWKFSKELLFFLIVWVKSRCLLRFSSNLYLILIVLYHLNINWFFSIIIISSSSHVRNTSCEICWYRPMMIYFVRLTFNYGVF